jgi:putative ABC transport system permease protein
MAAIVGVIFADLLMWMQLGFLNALFDSALVLPRSLRGDLVVYSPLLKAMQATDSFPRRLLQRAKGHPDVEAIRPLYVGRSQWRSETDGQRWNIAVYGVDPADPALLAPGVIEFSKELRQPDSFLFDEGSRPEFGPIADQWRSGQSVLAEVNKRTIEIVGLTRIGVSFQTDGNLITSPTNFQRLFNQNSPARIDLGVVSVRPGNDIQAVKKDLSTFFGNEMKVATCQEFVARETDFMRRRTPITFVFTLGTAVGFLVGFAIVYQILFTDVSNNLPQYATLKAMGYTNNYLRQVVVQESLILSAIGYVFGTMLATGLYALARWATKLPMTITPDRAALIFALTLSMCLISGMLAMRKLEQADPAEVF